MEDYPRFARSSMMSMFRFVSAILFVCTATAQAADYPQRPVRLVVPYAAGGSTDTVARIIGARLSEKLGQQIVVDNRTGAGGIIGILGELERAGQIDTTTRSVTGKSLGEVLDKWDYVRSQDPEVNKFYRAAPGGVRTIRAYGQEERWEEMDLDRSNGCIRDIDHPYSKEGGLAVLFGNISENGCIVKTGAVKEHMYKYSGTARVFDQQETALNAIGLDGYEAAFSGHGSTNQ